MGAVPACCGGDVDEVFKVGYCKRGNALIKIETAMFIVISGYAKGP